MQSVSPMLDSSSAMMLVVLVGLAPRAMAQRVQTSYPTMAPLAQYLMPDSMAEIALARTAAPESISHLATILVLGRHGYERAVDGRNGFACLVERSWTSPFQSPGFWNPRIRSPVCFNPAAARSVLQGVYMRTQLALAGLSKQEILDSIRVAFATHKLPSPEPGAMAFMMSREGCLGDGVGPWLPHLMFELPRARSADWGANVAGSPIILHQDSLDPMITEYLIPVGHWTDGTAAPQH